MAVTNTVTKAVTLGPGEQFVLPPGAVLVGATDASTLVSTCTLPELETFACYEIVLIGEEEATSESRPFQIDGGFFLNQLVVGNQTYSIPNFGGAEGINVWDGGNFNVGLLKDFIDGNSTLNSLFLNTSISTGVEDNYGGISSICFKALPSTMTDCYILAYTRWPGQTNIPFRFYAQPYGTYTGARGKCTCV